MRPRALLGSGLLAFVAATYGRGADVPPKLPVDFNRQVRPILSENCFACHGPDAKARKAKLRLDTKEGILGRRGLIVPGNPAESELIARVTAHDPTEVMPPARSGKKLKPEQVELLRRWVEQGAAWSEHWAFVPPRRPLPALTGPGSPYRAWVRNPVDHFILARLQAAGLEPAPETDRATLLRRVSLDLTGLPPTVAELDAFLADRRPNAYEAAVDRLLASPRYGERMAMQWLDGARYADSHGFQIDPERHMWLWRDWVIDAFNRNMPFDRFTVEQLAGDLLPGATLQQKIATGFNRNHRINCEGGSIAEEWRIETVADRLETTAAVWMGLTLGCARCHDHKYDPISQREYYRLFAFFNNVPEKGVERDDPGNYPPFMKVPRPAEQRRLAKLDTALARAVAEVKEKESRLGELQAKWEKTAAHSRPAVRWATLKVTEATSAGEARLTVQPDGAIVARGAEPDTDTYTLVATTDLKELSAIRLEALPDDRLRGKGPGRSDNGNFVLTDVRVRIGPGEMKLASASADFSQQDYPVSAVIDADPKTGWAILPEVGVAHDAVFGFEKPVAVPPGAKLTVTLAFDSRWPRHQLGRFRVSATDEKTPHDRDGVPEAFLAILNTPAGKRSAGQSKELADYFRAHHAGEVTEADRKLRVARKARDDYDKAIPTVMVMVELPRPRDCFVLVRGQYDKHGEKVTAGLPAVLPPAPAGAPMNRIGLAQWLVDPGHPLTARVWVNRLWEQFFGVGLVKSTENFGAQGEPPSHPELLDWLATEFVRLGWDTRAIQRIIVTSAAYRQSSRVTPELLQKDPENRLVSRGPRFRLQAEMIRDNALAIAGLLVDRLGGPSVRPYMPEGIWDETQVYGNLRNYKHDKGDGLYRRTMYTIWKRTSAPPTLLLFDTPTRELCAVKRPRTNTPLQALALLNEVTFVEAARVLAERMMREGGPTVEEQVAYAFRLAVARWPTKGEMTVLASGLKRRVERFRKDPKAAEKLLGFGEYRHDPRLDPAELAARTMTASIILNLDETVTKE